MSRYVICLQKGQIFPSSFVTVSKLAKIGAVFRRTDKEKAWQCDWRGLPMEPGALTSRDM